MTESVDVLVIGGGIAGLSVGSAIAPHAKVVVLEREHASGYHSSGRSATFYHFGIGNRTVRQLTAQSRAFFENPGDGFAGVPLCRPTPALFIATAAMQPALDALQRDIADVTDGIARASEAEMLSLLPVLRVGGDDIVDGLIDYNGRRLDADALLQGHTRRLRRFGGEIVFDADVAKIARDGKCWRVVVGERSWLADTLVNAGGAWADAIALMAGVPPLGLSPLRRTIIMFDPPAEQPTRAWPFVKTVTDAFYMLPEAGKLLASPVDENPDVPRDAQPEEYDVALAAHRVEEYTTLQVRRIERRWSGLRTFAPDRSPVVGFDPRAPGFFWLAGQGGFGLQTSPAVADAAAALLLGRSWPPHLACAGLGPDSIAPERLWAGYAAKEIRV